MLQMMKQTQKSNTFESHKASKEASLECCLDLHNLEPEHLTTSFMLVYGGRNLYLPRIEESLVYAVIVWSPGHFLVIEDPLGQYLPF